MANHWYFGNNDKKEYIECPFDCPTKQYQYFAEENCITMLLSVLLPDRWYEDNITFYLDCPWYFADDADVWKNITEEALKLYRRSNSTGIDELHERQLFRREMLELNRLKKFPQK